MRPPHRSLRLRSARPAAAFAAMLACGAGCTAMAPPPLVLPQTEFPAPPTSAPVIGTELTLPDAVAIARARAPRLRPARLREDVAAGDLLAARGFPTHPEIAVSADYHQRWGEEHVELTVRHPFEIGWQRGWRIRAANAALSGARARSANTERTVVAGVEAAFLVALAAERMLALDGEAEEVSQQLVAAAMRRQAAGDLTEADRNLVRLDLARASARVRRSAFARDNARAELLALLGEADRPGLRLAGTLAGPARLPELSELVGQALRRRPDLAALAADAAQAVAEAGLANAVRRPNLGIQLGYAYLTHQDHGQNLDDRQYNVELSVGLPGAWNSGAGEIAAAEARAELAKAEQEAEARRIIARIAAARRDWRAARADAEAIEREVLPLARANLESARRAFEAGQADALRVLRARTETAYVRRSAVQQRLREALARVDLRRETAGWLPR